MFLPEPDLSILTRRAEIIERMRAIVPEPGGVIADERAMAVYECDGLTALKQLPLVVVLPQTTEQVASILKYCHENRVKIVPRGLARRYPVGRFPWRMP